MLVPRHWGIACLHASIKPNRHNTCTYTGRDGITHNLLNRKAKEELCNRGSIRSETDGTPFTRLCGNDDICLTRDTRSLRSSFFPSLSSSFPPLFHSPAVTTTPLGPSRSIPICGLRLMVQASVRVAPRASALSCAYLFVAFVTAGPFKRFSIVVSGGENRRPAGRPRLSFSLVLRWGKGRGESEREREFSEKCPTLERNKIKRRVHGVLLRLLRSSAARTSMTGFERRELDIFQCWWISRLKVNEELMDLVDLNVQEISMCLLLFWLRFIGGKRKLIFVRLNV